MEKVDPDVSSELVSVNPRAYDEKFVLKKSTNDLETLRKTFKPEPSSVLSQVRDFIPKLATANIDLQKRLECESSSAVDIEHIDNDGPHIEMNIALMDQSDSCDDDDDDDDDDSDSDSSSSDEINLSSEINENNIKLSKKVHRHTHGKPLIETVEEAISGDDDRKLQT